MIVITEEQLYEREGIPWDALDFPDNQDSVDILQAVDNSNDNNTNNNNDTINNTNNDNAHNNNDDYNDNDNC